MFIYAFFRHIQSGIKSNTHNAYDDDALVNQTNTNNIPVSHAHNHTVLVDFRRVIIIRTIGVCRALCALADVIAFGAPQQLQKQRKHQAERICVVCNIYVWLWLRDKYRLIAAARVKSIKLLLNFIPPPAEPVASNIDLKSQ